ncbi:hypothetical protein CDAR_543281 [Caerostris darwini]|uniref:Uncharacterized protein n=1 Tax=Caerostris darwini TaxID=1538125 RepID=A0AAV4X0P6_9ARAC|nr:hypothetical protein CDAR_543281 [Caerostris darwini]
MKGEILIPQNASRFAGSFRPQRNKLHLLQLHLARLAFQSTNPDGPLHSCLEKRITGTRILLSFGRNFRLISEAFSRCVGESRQITIPNDCSLSIPNNCSFSIPNDDAICWQKLSQFSSNRHIHQNQSSDYNQRLPT